MTNINVDKSEQFHRWSRHELDCINAMYESKTIDFEDFSRHWFNFLNCNSACINMLAAACRGTKYGNWFNKKYRDMNNEPLLHYLRQSRDSSFHNLLYQHDVSQKVFVNVTTDIKVDIVDGQIAFIKPDGTHNPYRTEGKITLSPVTTRGVTYPRPTQFRGRPLVTDMVLEVGAHALNYQIEIIAEARAQT